VGHLVPKGTTGRPSIHLPLLRRRLHPCTPPPSLPTRGAPGVARASSPRTSSPKTVSSIIASATTTASQSNHSCLPCTSIDLDEWLKVTPSWRMRSRSPSPHNILIRPASSSHIVPNRSVTAGHRNPKTLRLPTAHTSASSAGRGVLPQPHMKPQKRVACV
jgi:hypothetical protein